MLQSTLQLNEKKLPPLATLVTLTYPREWPEEATEWHRHFDVWDRRLQREHPTAFTLWRLEPQKRGAPHFHVVIWSWKQIDRKWLSQSWYEVVDSGDVRHLKAGTSRETIRSHDRVMKYVSKYCTKAEQESPWEYPGRHWGWRRRARRPVTLNQIALTPEQFFRARRLMRRTLSAKNGYHQAGGTHSGCWVSWSEQTTNRVIGWLEENYNLFSD